MGAPRIRRINPGEHGVRQEPVAKTYLSPSYTCTRTHSGYDRAVDQGILLIVAMLRV